MRPRSRSGHLSSLLFGLLTFATADAQTYYYLDQISVSPATPTTADAITITLNGSLSNTASYIVNTDFSIQGTTVMITVNAAMSGIGLDVLVPHSETLPVGNLAAGTYTIVITGTATLDMAAVPEHQFTVSAGEPTDCDSLSFLGVRWGVFSDSTIVLTVANASTDLFDYPGFVLLDEEGDTIASETVSYFGIGSGPQDHILTRHPGVLSEGSTVSGQLHLWSGFYTEQECMWPVTWDLCPEQACMTVAPYLSNLGDGIITATVPYTLEDSEGLILGNGTFVINPNNQGVIGQELCLPPGSYFLQLEQVGVVGGQLFFGLMTPALNSEMTQTAYVQGTGVNTAAITILERCSDLPNTLPDERTDDHRFHLTMSGDELIITGTDHLPLGRLELLDAMGRSIGNTFTTSTRHTWDLSGLSDGVYLVRGSRYRAVRFVH